MNPVSGLGSTAAAASIVTHAPVMPVRAVLSNAQRVPAPVDRFERSAGKPAAAVTYARNGSGGHGDADGDAG